MITREEALGLIEQAGFEDSLLHHSLEAEAVLRGLAKRLGKDEDVWGLAGLLHDLDFPETKNNHELHGLKGADMLEGRLPDEAVNAIRAHNGELNGNTPETDLDFALRCGESVTGLVSANALVRPNGMEGMKPKSLKKKMKDKAFARNVNRDIVRECDKLGLELGEFLQISIDSITPIADQVGLAK